MSAISPRILVVDDCARNRAVCSDALREVPGVEIVEAATGQRALQLARDVDFAMFLLEVNMPDMDGFELASLLRQEPRAADTPIVFATSELAERDYLTRGYRMGAVDFMVSASTEGQILAQKARVFIQMFRKRQELADLVARSQKQNAELQEKLEQFVREHDLLRAQATHDALTGLPNRALFKDRLRAALARAARNRQRFAVAYIDLDGFKGVNERHGQDAGDAIIRASGERLVETLRATDTVARLGGDEFALLLESLDSVADAEHVANKVHHILSQPVALPAGPGTPAAEVAVGVSIGVALYPDHGREIEELVTLADVTMFGIKRNGGGALVYPGHASAPRAEAQGQCVAAAKHKRGDEL